jgi:hypothetical protein
VDRYPRLYRFQHPGSPVPGHPRVSDNESPSIQRRQPVSERNDAGKKLHRAIVQSGGRSFEPAKLKEVEDYGERFFTKLGVADAIDPLAAARDIAGPMVRFMEVFLAHLLGERPMVTD